MPKNALSSETVGLLGVVAIVGLSTVVIALLGSGFDGGDWEWETLLAGLGAVLFAALTVGRIQAQIRQADRLAAEARERESYAARAVLPPALSALCTYSERCLTAITTGSNESSIPELPAEIIPVLRDCIRFADDPKRRELADMLGKLQVQASRLAGGRRVRYLPQNVLVTDAAEIYARASNLFYYARYEDDPETPQSLRSALRNCVIEVSDIHGLDQSLGRDEERFARALRGYGYPVG